MKRRRLRRRRDSQTGVDKVDRAKDRGCSMREDIASMETDDEGYVSVTVRATPEWLDEIMSLLSEYDYSPSEALEFFIGYGAGAFGYMEREEQDLLGQQQGGGSQVH